MLRVLTTRPVVGQVVLPDFEEQAQRTLAEAGERAARIIADAQQQAEGIRKAAYDEGYAAGLAQGGEIGIQQGAERGRREVHEVFAKRAENILEALGRLEAAVAASRGRIARDIQQGAYELLVAAAEYLARRSIRLERGSAAPVLADALEWVTSRPATVFLNPQDLEDLRELAPELLERLEPPAWQLEADAGLATGDVRIEHPEGVVRAGLEERLENLKRSLLGNGGGSAV